MITGTQHNTAQQPNRPCHLNRTTQHKHIGRYRDRSSRLCSRGSQQKVTLTLIYDCMRQRGKRVSWPKKLKRRWTHAESTRPQNPHRPPVTCAAPCPRSLVTRNSDHIVDRTLPVVDPPCCLAGDPFFLLLHPSTFFCFPHAPSSPSWPYSRQPHPLRILNPPPFYFLKQGPSLRSRRLEPLASKLSLTTRTHF
ncbi:hypothetical protein HDV62DRAFT_257494 [Trichoderma sp. SZMC 28011]